MQWEEFTFNSVQLHHHGSYSKQAIQIRMAFDLHPAGYDATSDEYGVRQRERDLDRGSMPYGPAETLRTPCEGQKVPGGALQFPLRWRGWGS